MADKKYQVFISSTYADLKNERRKILDILLMADCIPAGMEAFVASDVEQFKVIKKAIDLCDYYILIIGKRYGSINEETGLSYTEMEYEYAREKGIPVLVFALDESVELPEEKTETDPKKINSLKEFRKKALTNRLVSIWKTQDELFSAVAISIMRAKNENKRPGWLRVTEYNEDSLYREVMDLQKEKSKNVFEECKIEIEYIFGFPGDVPQNRKIEKDLKDLFRIIATEMLDISLEERTIKTLLLKELFGSHLYEFADTQFIKKLLARLKSLNLVSSDLSKDKTIAYWRLTPNGEKIRDKMILEKQNSKVI